MRHGHTKNDARTPTYLSWSSMCQRCTNSRRKDYISYGGRGICVFPGWLGRGGFAQFLLDVGERPPNTSLDRIDPDGHYEPGNVRWASKSVQAKNRSANAIEVNGEAHTTEEWARRIGITPGALRMRLSRGWAKEDAYTRKGR